MTEEPPEGVFFAEQSASTLGTGLMALKGLCWNELVKAFR
ncbi:MAG: hypothetical protein ACI909_001041 [Planctomycetota bacterium]